MSPYLAPSLATARTIIDVRWPNHPTALDGWIGNKAHQLEHSDHNPNVRGSVDAIDVDSLGDPSVRVHVPTIIAAACVHPAVHYVIHNRLYYDVVNRFRPVPYIEEDPHTNHIHISIEQNVSAEQSTVPWDLLVPVTWPSVMRLGATGRPVTYVQAYLNAYGADLAVDGVFGSLTDAAVRHFQVQNAVPNSVVDGQGDGIVGYYTRTVLETLVTT